MKQYRYPGAKPFTTQQQSLFFGREKEQGQLLQLIRLEPVVVLYSKSGLGKSSLLNAAIMPRLEEDGVYGPLAVRFGAWTEQSDRSPLKAIREILLEGHDQECFLDSLFPDERSLWFYAKKRQANSGQNRFILVFDQFEELFSYPEAAVLAFKKELNELLTTAIPTRIRRMVDVLSASQPDLLSETEDQHLHRPMEVKTLFAIRSDRLHLLDKLSDYLPNILRHNYELKALGREDARQAIVEPARKKGDFFSPPFSYEEEAIEKILAFLQDGEGRVEAIQLQILCQSFEEKVQKEKLSRLSPADIGGLEAIIANYYRSRIAGLGNEEEVLAARRLIEEGLVLEEEQQRLSLHEGQVAKFFQVSPALLTRLVDSHLLRAEPGPRGGYTYELSHDTLIQPVLQAKRERKAREAALEAEAEQHRQQQELEVLRQKAAEERRQREKEEALRKAAQAARIEAEKEKDNAQRNARRARIAAVAGFVLGLLASMAFIAAFSQYQRAQALRLEAEQQQQEAERQRDRAATLAIENQQRAEEALEAQQMAEAAKTQAEISAGEARRQAQVAEQQTRIARASFNRAEQALNEAQKQKDKAERAARSLEVQKNKIEEQRLLTDREAREFKEQAEQLQLELREAQKRYREIAIRNQERIDSLHQVLEMLQSKTGFSGN